MGELDYYAEEYARDRHGLAGKMSECRDCGSSIIWLKTKNGKKVAVEMEECHDDDEIYETGRHVCHWDVCGRF